MHAHTGNYLSVNVFNCHENHTGLHFLHAKSNNFFCFGEKCDLADSSSIVPICQHSSLSLSALLCLNIWTNSVSLSRGRCVLWCVKWLDGLMRFRFDSSHHRRHFKNSIYPERRLTRCETAVVTAWANGLYLLLLSMCLFHNLLHWEAWSISWYNAKHDVLPQN